MISRLAPHLRVAYHHGLSRAFRGMPQPVGDQPVGEYLEPLSCAVFGRPTFFGSNGENGLAWSIAVRRIQRGTRNPSSARFGSLRQPLNLSCVGQGCEEYAGTVRLHGGPANNSAQLMWVTSPWPRPIGENPGPRKPVHQEALVANLSPRGGVSLPKLTLPRLSFSHGRLAWEFRCGHTAAAPSPFPAGVTVAEAAREASCPVCAHLEAIVGRRRQEVAHV